MSGHRTATAAAALAAAGTAAVRCVDVVKVYGSGPSAVHALREVNLVVAFGEFVVVLGPSGSGKTTLLNLIGVIEPPTSGRIVVAGIDIAGMDEPARTAHRRDRVAAGDGQVGQLTTDGIAVEHHLARYYRLA